MVSSSTQGLRAGAALRHADRIIALSARPRIAPRNVFAASCADFVARHRPLVTLSRALLARQPADESTDALNDACRADAFGMLHRETHRWCTTEL
jgi:hypothetical protein